ncbi:MAG TPA: translocation/assembly module TamB domain-containing protein [Candidatus Krumholzibacteria bacterium]|nr:translocation/assembly module TamB domain-containing protein [Candidatus Krumholzibacteria bacterium]
MPTDEPQVDPVAEPTPRPRRWRRVLRIAWRTLAVAFVLVVSIVVGVLAVPEARLALLERGLDAGLQALPGQASVRAQWPTLGRVELEDFRWRVDAQRVAEVDRAMVDLDLGALWDHDAVVRVVRLQGAWIDADRAEAAFAAAPADTAAEPAPSEPTEEVAVPWLRDGALAGLPSVAVDTLAVRDVEVISAAGSMMLHDLALGLDLRPGREQLGRVDLDVSIDEIGRVAGGVALAVTDSLRAHFDVWSWAPPGTSLAPRAEATGLDAVVPSDIVVRALRGDLVVVPAVLHGRLVERRPATVDLAARWRADGGVEAGLRVVLDDRPTWASPWVAAADSATAAVFERLLATWPADSVAYEIALDLRGRLDEAGVQLDRARVEGSLPGPAELVVGLPAPTWSRSELRLVARPRGDDAVDLVLDLGSTAWIDRGRVVALVRDTGAVSADTLDLRLPGLSVRGDGRWSPESIDVDLEVRAATSELEALVPSPPWGEVDAEVRADLQVAGALPLPRGELRIDGRASAPFAEVPDLRLRAEHDGDSVRASLDLPEGFTLEGDRFATPVRVGARGRLDLPEWSVRLTGTGPGLDLDLRAAADSTIAGEGSLVVDAGPLRDALPMALAEPLATSTLQRATLDLDAELDPDAESGRAGVGVDVRLEEGSLLLRASGDADLRGRARAQVDTLRVRWRDETIGTRRPMRFDLDTREPRYVLEELDLDGSLGTVRGAARVDSSGAQGDFEVALSVARDRLLEWAPDLEEIVPRTDRLGTTLTVDLSGTAADPRATIEGAARLDSDDDSRDVTLRWSTSYGADGDGAARLRAGLELTGGSTTWVQADAAVPLDLSLDPFSYALRPDDTFDLDVETPRLDLQRLTEFARAPVDVQGDLAMEMHAHGPLDALDVDGFVRSEKARAEFPDGGFLQTATSIVLTGTLLQPTVEGEVRVDGGLILLPAPPPALLPVEGESMLWAAIEADRTVAELRADRPVSPIDTLTLPLPDVAVSLNVPGGLRLRGHGLDVELRGRVDALVENGTPGIGGSLEVWRGRLDLLGRRFQVETGRVIFDPDQVEPDPRLDIRLATTIEGTRFTVDVTGTALEPQLRLGSEPEMPEGDIVASLLFGRPLDELDEGQSELLAQRTRQIAAAYGAAALSQQIGQRLGVDILSIEPAGDGGSASLVVGQYLSPDVIVQYEQVLEEGAAALIRLEYAMTRSIRLETVASQGEGSGVQIEWRKDY